MSPAVSGNATFDSFNHSGSVDVIVDVFGLYLGS